jgi:hypothetical protein
MPVPDKDLVVSLQDIEKMRRIIFMMKASLASN